MNKILLIITLIISYNFINAQNEIYKKLTPEQCDSLIKVNYYNPNFVILDVRTPQEYEPQHLKGAINRNYYDMNFDAKLDSLNNQKIYLIHCKSGGRSAKVFEKMKMKVFKEVYEMKGGISAWISNSLSTTEEFAPRIALVSDSIVPNKVIKIGEIDTISITVTNRENDTLKFLSITSLDGNHYSTDFDIDTTLLGSDDYTFNIYHEPLEELSDTFDFVIESNSGEVKIHIQRTDVIFTKSNDNIISQVNLFPNPAQDYLELNGLQNTNSLLEIMELNGKIVYSKNIFGSVHQVDLSGFINGIYIVKISNNNNQVLKKLIVNKN